ncbi:MAG: zinc transporter ZupT [bacterium]
MESNVSTALLLSFLAGISTGIGGILAFFIKKDNVLALSLGLGFSAGVMIYVSFTEILQESKHYLMAFFGNSTGEWLSIALFFTGIGLTAFIDKIIPDDISHHVFNISDSEYEEKFSKCKLCRTGLFVALIIALHNFPEGLTTFMAGLTNLSLGVSIAIAIAIHNIPEGIAVALPIYHATKSKRKAFALTLLSGMTEPLGALIGYFFLKSVLNDFTFGTILALVAGIMIYISFDELLPMAREYGNGHVEILGVTFGMLVMAVSLMLF